MQIPNTPLFIVLDDENVLRDMNVAVLKRSGVNSENIVSYSSANEAIAENNLPRLLAQAENQNRELVVITDYNMPGGDADVLYTFLDKLITGNGRYGEQSLKISSSQLKILGITGNQDPDVHTKALSPLNSLETVVKDFLLKPYGIYDLNHKLIDALQVPITRLIKPTGS